MAQATTIGLYSDNVVTVLYPSSTINCVCNFNTTTTGPVQLVNGTLTLSFPPACQVQLSGYVSFDISACVTPASVSVSAGTFLTQIPVPGGYTGLVIIPFNVSVIGTATILATTNGITLVASPQITYTTTYS